MLGFIFGLNSRVGRLHYFLATIVLAVIMTAISFAIAGYLFERLPRGAELNENDLLTWPVIAAGLLFVWVTFNLQAMRLRDIGWDPVCVIPGWITIVIVDSLVAHRVPAWAIGHDHQGTIVGVIVNLVLLAALMFWPSDDSDSWRPSLGEPRMPYSPPQKSNASNSPGARIAQARRSDFGGRS